MVLYYFLILGTDWKPRWIRVLI